jgi:hypothetical protein
MERQQTAKAEHQSGARIALGILGFIVGLTALLIILKLVIG